MLDWEQLVPDCTGAVVVLSLADAVQRAHPTIATAAYSLRSGALAAVVPWEESVEIL